MDLEGFKGAGRLIYIKNPSMRSCVDIRKHSQIGMRAGRNSDAPVLAQFLDIGAKGDHRAVAKTKSPRGGGSFDTDAEKCRGRWADGADADGFGAVAVVDGAADLLDRGEGGGPNWRRERGADLNMVAHAIQSVA